MSTKADLTSEAVAEHLAQLDGLIGSPNGAEAAVLVHNDVRRAVQACRVLLERHYPDQRGRCPQCSGWLLSKRFPCQSWRSAAEILFSCEVGQPGRHCAGPLPSAGTAAVPAQPALLAMPTR